MQTVVVVAGIIWKQKTFLIQQRPAKTIFGQKWEFPGGKVSENESLERALIRELEEELDFQINCDYKIEFWQKKIHQYQEKNIEVDIHFYNIFNYTGKIEPKESQTVEWIDYCNPSQSAESLLKKFDFIEADIDIIKLLFSDDKIKRFVE